MSCRYNDGGRRDSRLFRSTLSDDSGKIRPDCNQITDNDGSLLLPVAENGSAGQQRISRSFTQPFMEIAGHREWFRRSNFTLGESRLQLCDTLLPALRLICCNRLQTLLCADDRNTQNQQASQLSLQHPGNSESDGHKQPEVRADV
jgi:hypothetical protein